MPTMWCLGRLTEPDQIPSGIYPPAARIAVLLTAEKSRIEGPMRAVVKPG